MSWEDNLSNDAETDARFVRATCRMKILHTEFALVSGNVYSVSFAHGPVVSLTDLGTAKTAGASSSLSSGQYYYDRDTQLLYINLGGAPSSGNFIVVEFYVFFASEECIWHETPDDDTSALVQWNGLLKKAPSFRLSIPPQAIGFFPIEPTSLEITNDHSLNYILSRGSFYRTSCDAWHQLGDRDVDNIVKSLTGLFGLRISINEDAITFDVVDKSIGFDGAVQGGSYYSGAAVDPRYQGSAMMKLLGSPNSAAAGTIVGVPLFEMVNLGYNAEAPTTANNRTFGLIYDASNQYAEGIAPGNCTNDKFNLTNASDSGKFLSGQRVWFDANSGPGADLYFTVDSVVGSQVIFTTSGSGTVKPGNLRVSVFREVVIAKGGDTPVRLSYGRDYVDTLHSGNIRGITMTATAESNNSVATFDPSADYLFTCVDGANNQLQNGGVDYGTATSAKSALQVFYQFLREQVGLEEAEINFASFTDADPYITWRIYLPLPLAQLEDYPDVRTVMDLVLKSMLLRAFFSSDGTFKIMPWKPISSVAESIAKEEIQNFEFEIDYAEMKKIALVSIWDVTTANRIAFSGGKDLILAGTAPIRVVQTGQDYGVIAASSSNEGLYLHQIQASETFQHCVQEVSGSDFESRLLDLYGERSGRMTITGKRIALRREPGDDLTVYRDSLPGAVDAEGNSANFELLDVDKADGDVTLVLGDNKAADDKASESYW
jgi:hypothetical protein